MTSLEIHTIKRVKPTNAVSTYRQWRLLTWRFHAAFVLFLFPVRWWRKLQESVLIFVLMIIILGFPISSCPSSGQLKVSSNIKMLFLPCNLRLHSPSSLSPFLHGLSLFFISPLVCELFVFLVEPILFELLFKSLACWVIVLIIWFSFKPIFLVEHCWLIWSVEVVEWIWLDRLLVFVEFWEPWHWDGPGIGGRVVSDHDVVACSCWCIRLPKVRHYASCNRSCTSIFRGVRSHFKISMRLCTFQAVPSRCCGQSWWYAPLNHFCLI